MIGQKRLLKKIDTMIDHETFPRFVINQGAGNCGKKTVSKYIANKLGAQFVVSGIKVDEIRDIILLSYKQSEPTLYLIPDADKMSPAAKNALLKITEEPPRKAYFIMTLQDAASTLETLRSRGTIFSIDPYKPEELLDYLNQNHLVPNESDQKIVLSVCSYPGEIDILARYDIADFYQYIKLVVENIGTVSGANAFKIGTKLAYKDGDSGWNLQLFLKTAMLVFRERMPGDCDQACYDSLKVTSKYLSELTITGINKSSTIDMWILDLREIWVDL